MQITRDRNSWHFTIRNIKTRQIEIGVSSGTRAMDRPTVARGSVTCPCLGCGYTTSAKAVRTQLALKNGGADDARLLAVYMDSPNGRYFLNAIDRDKFGIKLASNYVCQDELPKDEINPIRPYKNTRGLSAVTRIGIKHFSDLYSSRQASVIQCFQRILLRLPAFTKDNQFRIAVIATLQCAVSRFIFQNSSLSRWNAARSTVEGAFGKQALQVVWDFAEINPLSDGPANWSGAIDWVSKVIEANRCLLQPGTVVRGHAQERILPEDAADALVVADASRPRQRGGGWHPLLARREAPQNHADQADIGRQSLRLFRPRGLSAAPLLIHPILQQFHTATYRMFFCLGTRIISFRFS